MKKLIALFLAMTLLLAFAGCKPAFDPAAKSEGVMTHAEYAAADLKAEVVVECYVQTVESWWDGNLQIYAHDPDGGYYIYNYACTEEDAAKFVPGTKIKVTGFKDAWAGEVEIVDATIEIMEGTWLAKATDRTSLLGSSELEKHMNELVAFKGLTVVASNDASGNEVPYLYKWDGSGSQGDDLYFKVAMGENVFTFTVNAYMVGTGSDSATYKAVEALKVGDKIDVEGFLYWYEGAQPHVTSVKVG